MPTGVKDTAKEELLAKVQSMHEINPMMGLRGCRLSIVFPQIVEMQTKAILQGAINAKLQGFDPHPEIMIPLVGHVNELPRSSLEPRGELPVKSRRKQAQLLTTSSEL